MYACVCQLRIRINADITPHKSLALSLTHIPTHTHNFSRITHMTHKHTSDLVHSLLNLLLEHHNVLLLLGITLRPLLERHCIHAHAFQASLISYIYIHRQTHRCVEGLVGMSDECAKIQRIPGIHLRVRRACEVLTPLPRPIARENVSRIAYMYLCVHKCVPVCQWVFSAAFRIPAWPFRVLPQWPC